MSNKSKVNNTARVILGVSKVVAPDGVDLGKVLDLEEIEKLVKVPHDVKNDIDQMIRSIN